MDNPDPLSSIKNRSDIHGNDINSDDDDDDIVEFDINSTAISRTDVFEIIRDIKDPEHQYTLEALKVIRRRQITVEDDGKDICNINIEFTPTVPHCSLATTIGLCIREKLRRDLPKPAKVTIFVTPGAHSTEHEINKQVNDKERVSAALENPELLRLTEECINYHPDEY